MVAQSGAESTSLKAITEFGDQRAEATGRDPEPLGRNGPGLLPQQADHDHQLGIEIRDDLVDRQARDEVGDGIAHVGTTTTGGVVLGDPLGASLLSLIVRGKGAEGPCVEGGATTIAMSVADQAGRGVLGASPGEGANRRPRGIEVDESGRDEDPEGTFDVLDVVEGEVATAGELDCRAADVATDGGLGKEVEGVLLSRHW